MTDPAPIHLHPADVLTVTVDRPSLVTVHSEPKGKLIFARRRDTIRALRARVADLERLNQGLNDRIDDLLDDPFPFDPGRMAS